jgi:hypothetical protein
MENIGNSMWAVYDVIKGNVGINIWDNVWVNIRDSVIVNIGDNICDNIYKSTKANLKK